MTTKKVLELANSFLSDKIKEIELAKLTPKQKAFIAGIDFAKKFYTK